MTIADGQNKKQNWKLSVWDVSGIVLEQPLITIINDNNNNKYL